MPQYADPVITATETAAFDRIFRLSDGDQLSGTSRRNIEMTTEDAKKALAALKKMEQSKSLDDPFAQLERRASFMAAAAPEGSVGEKRRQEVLQTLDDFDVKGGSRSAKTSQSNKRQLTKTTVMSDNDSSYDESVRRGILNSQIYGNEETNPDAVMNQVLNGGAFSVTTGCMDDMENLWSNSYLPPTATNEDYYFDDTYTYHGSTITSARDITYKRSTPQNMVIDIKAPAGVATMNNMQQENNVKAAEVGSVMSNPASSSKSEESKEAGICFGLGKIGLLWAILTVLAVAVAIMLFLLLGNKAPPANSTSGCCQGLFEQSWRGREICNAQGACCVVCASSIISGCCQGSFEQGWSGREICNAQGTCCIVCASSIVIPNNRPTGNPQETPMNTYGPTEAPIIIPEPSTSQTGAPLAPLTLPPIQAPITGVPSRSPVLHPTTPQLTNYPTPLPTPGPTAQPTTHPTAQPTTHLTAQPTTHPTPQPTVAPTPKVLSPALTVSPTVVTTTPLPTETPTMGYHVNNTLPPREPPANYEIEPEIFEPGGV
jgi:hypothetical protein